jgi:uncharacterized protein YbaR (Trm112 family)
MASDWLEVPAGMLSEVLRLIDPVPDRLSSADLRDIRRKELERQKLALVDVPRSLVESLIEYLGVDLTCDHAVNICVCAEKAAHYKLQLLLEGKLVCRQCGGDRYVFDQATYDSEVKKYAEWAGVTEGEIRLERDDDAGMIQCPTCKGTGLTRVSESG